MGDRPTRGSRRALAAMALSSALASAISVPSSSSTLYLNPSTTSGISGASDALPSGIYPSTTSQGPSNPGKRRRDAEEDEQERLLTKRSRHLGFEPPSDGRISRLSFHVDLGSFNIPSAIPKPANGSNEISQQEDPIRYAAALCGLDTSLEPCYEYGSGSDDEDKPRTETTGDSTVSNAKVSDLMVTTSSEAVQDHSSQETVSDDVPEAMDISEDDFNAVMEDVLQQKSPARIPGISVSVVPDGYDGDDDEDEDEDELHDGESVVEELNRGLPRRLRWKGPPPSPLRQAHNLVSMTTLQPRSLLARISAPGLQSRFPVSRSLREAWVEDRREGIREAMDTLVAFALQSALAEPDTASTAGNVKVEASDGVKAVDDGDAEIGEGEGAESEDEGADVQDETDSDGESGEEEWDDDDMAAFTELPMGRGTPAGEEFLSRPTLQCPPTQYVYKSNDPRSRERTFTQSTLHGAESWALLDPSKGRPTLDKDSKALRLPYYLKDKAEKTEAVIRFKTDRKAMRFWREHQEEVDTLLIRPGHTTASILEEAKVTKRLLEGPDQCDEEKSQSSDD